MKTDYPTDDKVYMIIHWQIGRPTVDDFPNAERAEKCARRMCDHNKMLTFSYQIIYANAEASGDNFLEKTY